MAGGEPTRSPQSETRGATFTRMLEDKRPIQGVYSADGSSFEVGTNAAKILPYLEVNDQLWFAVYGGDDATGHDIIVARISERSVKTVNY